MSRQQNQRHGGIRWKGRPETLTQNKTITHTVTYHKNDTGIQIRGRFMVQDLVTSSSELKNPTPIQARGH